MIAQNYLAYFKKGYYPLVFIILNIGLPSTLLSQSNLTIRLCAMEHEWLTKSLVVVTGKDNKSIYEHILTKIEIENGSIFTIPILESSKYEVSIINEYLIDSLCSEPFIRAYTYCDIEDEINILSFKHPVRTDFPFSQPLSIKIINTPVMEDYRVFTVKPNDEYLDDYAHQIYGSVQIVPGCDLFMILKAIGDPKYRYLYMSAKEISEINVQDVFSADWRFLPTDLYSIEIPVPLNTLGWGYISAINEDTGNLFPLFSYWGEIAIKDIHLLIPRSYNLDNFTTDLTLKSNDPNPLYYNYKMNGEKITLPAYAAYQFQYSINDTIPTKITTSLNQLSADYYEATFASTSLCSCPIISEIALTPHSFWHFIGKNKKEINLNIPKPNMEGKEYFTLNAENGVDFRLKNFKLIKVLEPEMDNFDWINYPETYNVLFVEQRK